MAEVDGRRPDAQRPGDRPPPGDVPLPTETEHLAGESNPEVLPSTSPWRQIVHAVGVLEQVIAGSLLVLILALVITLVAQRYLPGANLPWTGEIARYSMVWSTFIVAGFLTAHDRHIAIRVIDHVLGERSLAGVKLFVNLFVAATCVALAYAVYVLIVTDIGQVTPAAGLPLRFVNAVPIVGFILTAFRSMLWIALDDIPALMGRRSVT
ncbi:MAG TPA: TRAP transporter small permease [Candidatus Tectomicrobia bacterium]|nr:TRAP transporter small permease [Candidatus Tectomicrobia bacterium]